MASSSTCNKEFSINYMLLDADEVSLVDLFHILFSSDIEKRKFVDVPGVTDEKLNSRWIIFLSVLAQKFLLSVSKPLAWFGSTLEYTLNLVSCNRNVFVLLLHFLRGKVVMPDKLSPTFLSFTGNMDKRVELDTDIKPGDIRYEAALSIMAAKASYENKAYLETTVKNNWKMEFLGSFDFWNDYQDKPTTQAFMLHDKTSDPDVVVVAFRGTETFDADAWSTDVDLSWYELQGMGKIHGGFMKALGLMKCRGFPNEVDQGGPDYAYYFIREKLRKLMPQNEKTKFIVTGHSLGGALAILFPAILAFHNETELLKRLKGIYTFGQPRVGDVKFGEFMQNELNKYGVPYYRFVYCNDIVPRLPYDNSALMFKHFGTCLYNNSFYKGQIVAEEPNKNYFNLLWAIPKMVNAVWEILRSFLMPYMKGPKYRECSFLKMFRLMGLMVAGVPAHMPQDYVNSTRLASPDLYFPRQDQNVCNGSSIKWTEKDK